MLKRGLFFRVGGSKLFINSFFARPDRRLRPFGSLGFGAPGARIQFDRYRRRSLLCRDNFSARREEVAHVVLFVSARFSNG